KVEVGVFVGGDDVVRPDGFGERSVLDVPRRRNALRLVAAPPVRRGPVEEKLPPGGALGVGEGVVGLGARMSSGLLAMDRHDEYEEGNRQRGETNRRPEHRREWGKVAPNLP